MKRLGALLASLLLAGSLNACGGTAGQGMESIQVLALDTGIGLRGRGGGGGGGPVGGGGPGAATTRRSVSAEDMVRLADVAAFITAHCADELPLERLGRIGCMSISKLKDAFHVRYGCTITQSIQGQRTEQAGRLLREPDLPVSQVAAIVGYQNPSRFAEIFRRNTGRSPAEYSRAY